MAGWYGSGVFKPIACAVCGGVFKPKSGAHKFCSVVCKGRWKYITGQVSTESQYAAISGNWSRYMQRLLYHKRKGKTAVRKEAGITLELLLSMLQSQNYLCALSGVEMTCTLRKGVRCITNASVDRVDSSKPYSPDNIQLVCSAINMLKLNMSTAQFVWFCTKVAEHSACANVVSMRIDRSANAKNT